MKFKDIIFEDNVVVHCDTEEKAKNLLKYAHEKGYKWYSGDSYLGLNYFERYGDMSGYNISGGLFGDIVEYLRRGRKILKYEEVVLREGRKFKGGDRVRDISYENQGLGVIIREGSTPERYLVIFDAPQLSHRSEDCDEDKDYPKRMWFSDAEDLEHYPPEEVELWKCAKLDADGSILISYSEDEFDDIWDQKKIKVKKSEMPELNKWIKL